MQYKNVAITEIEKSPYNPRLDLTPNDAAFLKIKASLEEFGCVEPIIVNEVNNRCVGGHQRLSVMRSLGYKEVPCVFINEPDEMKEKALNVALNKIDNQFDENKLSALLVDLSTYDIDLDVTGFNTREIEDLLAEVDTVEVQEEEEAAEEKEVEASDVICKVSTYNFRVERDVYLNALNEIRRVAGFDDESITAEFKRRLKA